MAFKKKEDIGSKDEVDECNVITTQWRSYIDELAILHNDLAEYRLWGKGTALETLSEGRLMRDTDSSIEHGYLTSIVSKKSPLSITTHRAQKHMYRKFKCDNKQDNL